MAWFLVLGHFGSTPITASSWIFRGGVSFILVRTIEDTSSGAMILSSPLTCRVNTCNLSVATVKVKDTLRVCTWVEPRNPNAAR